MALARRTEYDPLASDSSAGSAGGDGTWLTSYGTRRGGKLGKSGKIGKGTAIGGQRGGLLTKPTKGRQGRLKGVKRL